MANTNDSDYKSLQSLIAHLSADDVHRASDYLDSPAVEMQKAAEIIRANPHFFQAIRTLGYKLESSGEEVSSLLRGAVLILVILQNKYELTQRNQDDIALLEKLFTD